MVVATLLWGGTFVVIRDSLRGLDPQALVFARFALAGAVFSVFVLARGRRPSRAVLVWGAASGLFSGTGYLLQAIGLIEISAGSSAFLTCAGSLFTGLLAWPLLHQRPGNALLAGLGLALAGAALLSLDASLRLGRNELITLAGALSFAFAILAVGKLGSDFDPLALAAVQSWTTALLLAGAAPLAFEQISSLSPAGWARFGYLVVAGSLLATLLMLTAQRALPPGRIGLLLALEPVFALVFAVAFGGERFIARWWLGAALILSAVALVEWPSLRGRTKSPATTARTAE
ncbi:MAG: DMT family transporter [Candidatus Eisenbacteria bacterium]